MWPHAPVRGPGGTGGVGLQMAARARVRQHARRGARRGGRGGAGLSQVAIVVESDESAPKRVLPAENFNDDEGGVANEET